jgi:serine phosphatase RsbU (regulator of sigma subunit)
VGVTGFAVAALVASATATVSQTAGVAAAATFMVAVSAAWNQDLGSGSWWRRLVLTGIFCLLAVCLAKVRVRHEQALLRMTIVAETAQRALLRTMPSDVDGMRFAARYKSAAEAASVGGDLYEVADTTHGVRVIIGDVRGKGLEAVYLASTVLAAFRRGAFRECTLEQVAADLDVAVTSVAGDEDFVTALLAEFPGDGTATLVNLGHHAPLLIDDHTPVGFVDTGQPQLPLGLGPVPTAVKIDWPEGARMLLFTDGLVEARDRTGTFFPLENHGETLRSTDLGHALDGLLHRLDMHVGHRQQDDLALILTEHGAAAPA